MTSTPIRLLFLILLAGFLAMARAEVRAPDNTLCVGTVDELHQALNVWAYNSGDDETVVVQVVKGSYNFTPLFDYTAQSDATLRLLGGYNAGCGSRTIDPTNTVLDGNNVTGIGLDIRSGNVKAEGLTIKRYTGFNIFAGDDAPGEIFIKHCILRDAILTSAYGISAYGGGTRVRLENLLVVNNQFAGASTSSTYTPMPARSSSPTSQPPATREPHSS